MATSSNLASAVLQTAAQDSAVIYALDTRFRLTYCNPAWDRFALENGGESVVRSVVTGWPILELITGPLREIYRKAYVEVLETGRPWQTDYECSSEGRFRMFTMQVLPLRDQGLLSVNSLRVEYPHQTPKYEPVEQLYRDQDGLVTMCGNCRKVRRPQTVPEPAGRVAGERGWFACEQEEVSREAWDWVPAFVASPPENISHGLCAMCLAYYYGG